MVETHTAWDRVRTENETVEKNKRMYGKRKNGIITFSKINNTDTFAQGIICNYMN